MTRFDIPENVKVIIEKAVEINLIDCITVYALGETYGTDFTAMVEKIQYYAYCNVHINNDHNIIVPLVDEYHKKLKEKIETPVVVEEPPVVEEDDVFVEEKEEEEMSFTDRFLIFFDGCIKINQDYCERNGYTITDDFSYKTGKRYMKVNRGSSVHCFVDITNGDVLKAASWKAPAKHARGNIYDDAYGLKAMGEYGPAYLRK